MQWLKARHWKTCSHRTLCDIVLVIHARDAAGMEVQTPQCFIYVERLIDHRLVVLRRENS